jgi:hypothetical protein
MSHSPADTDIESMHEVPMHLATPLKGMNAEAAADPERRRKQL